MGSEKATFKVPLEVDRELLLQLARGGNLYRDRFARLRELIQNAADATLLRRGCQIATGSCALSFAVRSSSAPTLLRGRVHLSCMSTSVRSLNDPLLPLFEAPDAFRSITIEVHPDRDGIERREGPRKLALLSPWTFRDDVIDVPQPRHFDLRKRDCGEAH